MILCWSVCSPPYLSPVSLMLWDHALRRFKTKSVSQNHLSQSSGSRTLLGSSIVSVSGPHTFVLPLQCKVPWIRGASSKSQDNYSNSLPPYQDWALQEFHWQLQTSLFPSCLEQQVVDQHCHGLSIAVSVWSKPGVGPCLGKPFITLRCSQCSNSTTRWCLNTFCRFTDELHCCLMVLGIVRSNVISWTRTFSYKSLFLS